MYHKFIVLFLLFILSNNSAFSQKAKRLIKKNKYDKAEQVSLAKIQLLEKQSGLSKHPINFLCKLISAHHYYSIILDIKGKITQSQDEIAFSDSLFLVLKAINQSRKGWFVNGYADGAAYKYTTQYKMNFTRKILLANIFMEIGEMSSAKTKIEEYQENYLVSPYADKNSFVFKQSYSMLGKYYYLTENYDTSKLFYSDYIRSLQSNPRYIDDTFKNLSEAYVGLGHCYLKLGDLDNAKLASKKAVEYSSHTFAQNFVGIKSTEINSYNLLAETYRQDLDYAAAKKWNDKALNLYNDHIQINSPAKLPILATRGKLYWVNNDTLHANHCFKEIASIFIEYIQNNFPYLSESEREFFYRSNKHYIELVKSYYQYLFFEKGYKEQYIINQLYNTHINSKGLLLSAASKLEEKINNTGDAVLINKYLLLRELKDARIKLSNSGSIADMAVIDKVISETERQILSKINIEIEKYITYDSILASIPDGSQLLDILRVSQFSIQKDSLGKSILHETKENKYLYFISKADRSRFELIQNLETQSHLEKKYYTAYSNFVKFSVLNTISYDIYFKPIETSITSKKLIISGDGIYNLLNPALFYSDNKYLIDTYEFLSIALARDLLNADKNKNSIKNVTLVGWPDYSTHKNTGGENPVELPGTEKEIESIKSILPASIPEYSYVRKQATENVVKALPSRSVLHFATHGYFEVSKLQDAMYTSGLVLAISDSANNKDDGYLSAYEASNLNLSNTFLVVMSACETAQGEIESGEGVWGLQRAFQVAGVRYVVMSMFKVNDEVTALLMKEFYSNIIAGEDVLLAFRHAQLTIKQKYTEANRWGAFIIKGY